MQINLCITQEILPGIIFWVIWGALILIFLSLVLGSFREHEPKAGKIFGLISLVILCAGIVFFFMY